MPRIVGGFDLVYSSVQQCTESLRSEILPQIKYTSFPELGVGTREGGSIQSWQCHDFESACSSNTFLSCSKLYRRFFTILSSGKLQSSSDVAVCHLGGFA